jgi:alpha-2-macroglobulin
MRTFSWTKLLVCSILAMLITVPTIPALAKELRVVAYPDESYAGKQPGDWSVHLRFNYPVFRSDLIQALKVTSKGEDQYFKVKEDRRDSSSSGAVREFNVRPATAGDKPADFRLLLAKDLSDASGRRVLARDFVFRFSSLKPTAVTNVSTFYRTAQDKGVTLTLSKDIALADVRKALSVSPAVKDLKISKAPGYRSWKLTGSFVYDLDYTLELRSVKSKDGGTVLASQPVKFKGPGLPSKITIKTKQSVIELLGRQLIPLSLESVTKVRCSLTRVPPYFVPEVAELLNKGNKDEKWKKRITKALYQLVESKKVAGGFLGAIAEDSEVFFSPEAQDHVYGYSLPLSFRDDPKKGGAWLARFTDPDKRFKGDVSRLVQISDLSITYKMSSRTLLLWVTSIHTGEPVSGVNLLLYQSDGTRCFVGRTDDKGLATVKNGAQFKCLAAGKEQQAPSERPLKLSASMWAVAATATDASAVELDRDRFKPLSVTQTETFKSQPESKRGYIFTERGVYRPGEKVHFKFVEREYKDRKISAPGGKMQLDIVDPRGDVHYSKQLSLSEFGSCHDTFLVEKFFPTGTYTIKASSVVPNEKNRTWTKTFLVAEYKRPRHKVSLTFKKDERESTAYVGLKHLEDLLLVTVDAQYYAGGPVKNARVRWKATLVPVTNKVKGLDGFFFGNDDTKTQFLESGESVLDRNGKLQVSIPLDRRLLSGLNGVRVSATVLDIDGEPATSVDTYNPRPLFLVGISHHPTKVAEGHVAQLKVVVVDRDGKKVSTGRIKSQIMRKEYFYSQKRDSDGKINYLWQQGWQKDLSTDRALANGEAVFDLELNRYDGYLIAFTYEKGGQQYSSRTQFQVGWQEYSDWIHDRKRKGIVTSDAVFLALDKTAYKSGERGSIEFHIRRPVKKCLVTVEREDILEYWVVDVNGTRGTFDFHVRDQYEPNAYISLIAPSGRQGYPVYRVQPDTDIPTVYFGYAQIKARSQTGRLKVKIASGEDKLKGKPGEEKTFEFLVTDHQDKAVVSELAVCVVDEAVLALTRFKTPNLATLNDFTIPLSVFSGDMRLSLISQDLYRIFSTRPLTGGGTGEGLVVNTIRKDFRPVAYFNPALVTDKKGSATIKFKLPDSTTMYRIYVVACDKGSGFASEDWRMQVTKEFFIEPALPRFLVPGDSLTFPVALTNRTNLKGDAILKADASKDIELNLDSSSTVLEPMDSTQLMAAARALGGEKAMFRFQGQFQTADDTFQDGIEKTIPLVSRYLPVNRAILGSFTRKGEITVPLPKALKKLAPKDIHPGDLKAYVTLSTTNWNKIAPGLRYLLRYPYGCVEQTSSGIIPLAAMRSLVKEGKIPGITLARVDKFLKPGLDRLLSMQLTDGGFAYWPGNAQPTWWGSLYATCALSMLKHQAGYDVPEERLTKAAKYLREGLFSSGGDRYHSMRWTKEMAAYALAMNKQLSESELADLFQDYGSLSDQGKAFLILAAHTIGYKPFKSTSALVSKLRPRLDLKRTNYNDSSYREVAICLLAAVETGASRKKADTWAGYLMRGIKPEGRWISTVDTGWCLLALSKYFEGQKQDKPKTVTCRVFQEGVSPTEVTVSEASAHAELDGPELLDTGIIKLEADTGTLINYTLYLKYPDLVTDPADLERGFSLKKKIENLNGKDEIRVGDVVRVSLELNIDKSITGDRWGRVEYLAMEDPVPAGLVPINSELKTEGAPDTSDEQSSRSSSWRDPSPFTPSHFEFRDDGVRVFKDRAWTGFYKYSYLARAVAQGEFWMRGSRISLMYDPEYFGKTKGKKITILKSK